jgi:hypothetical protein
MDNKFMITIRMTVQLTPNLKLLDNNDRSLLPVLVTTSQTDKQHSPQLTNSQTRKQFTFHLPKAAMKLILSLLLATVVNAGTYTQTIELGNAKNYVILAKSGIATVPDSTVVGDIGVSPIATTAFTGFGLTLDEAGMHATASQVQGDVWCGHVREHTGSLDPIGPRHANRVHERFASQEHRS